jgi:hypothetical protein
MKLTVYEKNKEKMADYLESCVIPQLREGYHSGYIACGIYWDIEGEEKPDEDNNE